MRLNRDNLRLLTPNPKPYVAGAERNSAVSKRPDPTDRRASPCASRRCAFLPQSSFHPCYITPRRPTRKPGGIGKHVRATCCSTGISPSIHPILNIMISPWLPQRYIDCEAIVVRLELWVRVGCLQFALHFNPAMVSLYDPVHKAQSLSGSRSKLATSESALHAELE
jgi:hypothetical protein